MIIPSSYLLPRPLPSGAEFEVAPAGCGRLGLFAALLAIYLAALLG